MNTAKFRENTPRAWMSQNCADKVIDILAYASPTHTSAQIRNLNDSTKLAGLNISKTKCDRIVRVLINQMLRDPKGWYSLPRGTIKPSSTIKECKKYGCEQ